VSRSSALDGLKAMVAARAPALVPADDATLVARHRAGDGAAFDELYHRHARYVAGTVYRLMGGRGERAELADVMQETFLVALESLPDLRQPECFRAWLVGIAVRRVRRRLDKQARASMLRRLLLAGAPQASDPAARTPVSELERALAELPPRLRIPWILHHVEGETLPSVASLEGVSLATVKRRIARAEARVQRRTHGDAR
jgi:RNA polymerase sigma-70 factor (ECF subfamily)